MSFFNRKPRQRRTTAIRLGRITSLFVIFTLLAGLFMALTIASPTVTQAGSVFAPAGGPVIMPDTLPNGTVGQSYDMGGNFVIINGLDAYNLDIYYGDSLPDGLSLTPNGSGYTITGVPTKAGTFNFRVEYSDYSDNNVVKSYSITIVAPTLTISPASLPNGTVGQSYNMGGNFSATGGNPPYTFSVVNPANLPPGLSLSGTTLIGTPTTAGTFTFTIQATDGKLSGQREYTVTIAPVGPPPGTPGYGSDPRPGQTINLGGKPGKPGTTNLTVSETGGATLEVSNPQITGDNAAEFAVLSPAFPFSIADGGAPKVIVLQCAPTTTGKRKAVLTLTTNDPTQPTVSYNLVCGVEDERKPADLVAQLRVTPDRDASIKPQTEITYQLKVTNVGPGEADAVRLVFPIDTNLIPAYTSFSDNRMWVSEMVTDGDHPYIKIGMPPVMPNQTFSATLVFHIKLSAKPGTVVEEHFTAGWDDEVHAGMSNISNSTVTTLVADKDRDDTKGAVMWFTGHGQKVALGKSIILTGDFYAPEEAVDFWYTDPSGKSVQLGMFWADKKGKISLEFSTAGLKEGQVYTIVGKGRRSGIMGSAAITVTAPDSGNGDQPKAPAEGLK